MYKRQWLYSVIPAYGSLKAAIDGGANATQPTQSVAGNTTSVAAQGGGEGLEGPAPLNNSADSSQQLGPVRSQSPVWLTIRQARGSRVKLTPLPPPRSPSTRRTPAMTLLSSSAGPLSGTGRSSSPSPSSASRFGRSATRLSVLSSGSATRSSAGRSRSWTFSRS